MNARDTVASIIPTMRYRDAVTAIEWLCRAFGFQQHLVVPDASGGIAHAQLVFGNGMVMLGSARDDAFGKIQKALSDRDAPVTQSCYIIVEDVDEHCRGAREAGAVVVLEPEDQSHGGRLYSCRDLEGHLWNFGSYDPWQTP